MKLATLATAIGLFFYLAIGAVAEKPAKPIVRTIAIASTPDGLPVEVEIDGTVVGVDVKGAPCGIVFDGRLGEFRNVGAASPRIFYAGEPFVKIAKLVGKSCRESVRVRYDAPR